MTHEDGRPLPTPDQAYRIAAVAGEILGADLVGAWLHGSAVLGGLRPNSDIDVLGVIRRPTTEAERRRLVGGLTAISRRGDPTQRSVELHLMEQSAVRPWRYPAPVDFMYGDWLGAEFDQGDPHPWRSPDPDQALLLTAVLAADRSIVGPPAADVIDPIPPDDVQRAVLDSIPELLGWLEGDEANVTLTFSRIWVTVETGTIVPKDVAADRVLPRLPPEHRAVLERARTIYLEGLGDDWDPELLTRVHPHVEHVHGQILRAAAANQLAG